MYIINRNKISLYCRMSSSFQRGGRYHGPAGNFTTVPSRGLKTKKRNGSNFQTVPTRGSNFQTVPGSNFQTVPGSNFQTVPGSNFQTVPGSNFTNMTRQLPNVMNTFRPPPFYNMQPLFTGHGGNTPIVEDFSIKLNPRLPRPQVSPPGPIPKLPPGWMPRDGARGGSIPATQIQGDNGNYFPNYPPLNMVNPGYIGYGMPHPSAGIADAEVVRGIPYQSNLPENFSPNVPVSYLGGTNVNPTWGSGTAGQNTWINGRFPIDPTNGMTGSPFQPFYGSAIPMDRNINAWSGLPITGSGLFHHDNLAYLDHGGMFDWLKAMFNKLLGKSNGISEPHLGNLDDWTMLPAIPEALKEGVEKRKRDKAFQKTLTGTAKALQNVIGKAEDKGFINDLKKKVIESARDTTTTGKDDGYLSSIWKWAANQMGDIWVDGSGCLTSVGGSLDLSKYLTADQISAFENKWNSPRTTTLDRQYREGNHKTDGIYNYAKKIANPTANIAKAVYSQKPGDFIKGMKDFVDASNEWADEDGRGGAAHSAKAVAASKSFFDKFNKQGTIPWEEGDLAPIGTSGPLSVEQTAKLMDRYKHLEQPFEKQARLQSLLEDPDLPESVKLAAKAGDQNAYTALRALADRKNLNDGSHSTQKLWGDYEQAKTGVATDEKPTTGWEDFKNGTVAFWKGLWNGITGQGIPVTQLEKMHAYGLAAKSIPDYMGHVAPTLLSSEKEVEKIGGMVSIGAGYQLNPSFLKSVHVSKSSDIDQKIGAGYLHFYSNPKHNVGGSRNTYDISWCEQLNGGKSPLTNLTRIALMGKGAKFRYMVNQQIHDVGGEITLENYINVLNSTLNRIGSGTDEDVWFDALEEQPKTWWDTISELITKIPNGLNKLDNAVDMGNKLLEGDFSKLPKNLGNLISMLVAVGASYEGIKRLVDKFQSGTPSKKDVIEAVTGKDAPPEKPQKKASGKKLVTKYKGGSINKIKRLFATGNGHKLFKTKLADGSTIGGSLVKDAKKNKLPKELEYLRGGLLEIPAMPIKKVPVNTIDKTLLQPRVPIVPEHIIDFQTVKLPSHPIAPRPDVPPSNFKVPTTYINDVIVPSPVNTASTGDMRTYGSGFKDTGFFKWLSKYADKSMDWIADLMGESKPNSSLDKFGRWVNDRADDAVHKLKNPKYSRWLNNFLGSGFNDIKYNGEKYNPVFRNFISSLE